MMPVVPRSSWFLLAIAYVGFISLGLPDPLIGVAWPSVQASFLLPLGAVAWVFLGNGFSYFLSSLLAGRMMDRLGAGLLLAASSGLVAVSGFGFGLAPAWTFFAACSVLHGLGSGAIDAGLNHYAAHHFSPRHMNWLHACYSLGATLGPAIMTTAITRGQWRAGYVIVAIILMLLSAMFAFTRRRWSDADAPSNHGDAQPPAAISIGASLRHRTVWLHAALFFLYTGLEFTVGQWSFTLLSESRGLSPAQAGTAVTGYFASIAAGRVFFGFVVNQLGLDRLLRLSTALALVGTVSLSATSAPAVSALALGIIGLGLAPIFPCLMSKTPIRLGSALARHAVGFQVSAAMIGGAVVPSLAGLSAQKIGLATLPFITLLTALSVLMLHEFLLRRDRSR
jgi:fucose permease